MRALMFAAALIALAACGQTAPPPAEETPSAAGPQTAEDATAQDTWAHRLTVASSAHRSPPSRCPRASA